MIHQPGCDPQFGNHWSQLLRSTANSVLKMLYSTCLKKSSPYTYQVVLTLLIPCLEGNVHFSAPIMLLVLHRAAIAQVTGAGSLGI